MYSVTFPTVTVSKLKVDSNFSAAYCHNNQLLMTLALTILKTEKVIGIILKHKLSEEKFF